METMYERIKRMTESEMQKFIYLVYICGNNDGVENLCDSYTCSYFGDYMLTLKAKELMPNDNVDDLYKLWLEEEEGE